MQTKSFISKSSDLEATFIESKVSSAFSGFSPPVGGLTTPARAAPLETGSSTGLIGYARPATQVRILADFYPPMAGYVPRPPRRRAFFGGLRAQSLSRHRRGSFRGAKGRFCFRLRRNFTSVLYFYRCSVGTSDKTGFIRHGYLACCLQTKQPPRQIPPLAFRFYITKLCKLLAPLHSRSLSRIRAGARRRLRKALRLPQKRNESHFNFYPPPADVSQPAIPGKGKGLF